MRLIKILLWVMCGWGFFMTSLQAQSDKITLVIHGGAGTIRKENMTDAMEQAYHAKLKEALEVGYQVLRQGGSSLDAVVVTIQILEDSPLFNAGKGAVFTAAGKNELDAAIMDGTNRKAGAVAGITTVKNPIKAARAVMDNSPHVMMIGQGAEEFAQTQGLEIVDPAYFYSEDRFKQLEKIKQREANQGKDGGWLPQQGEEKFGTVGAVALDQFGNLAAGTSTGGMTNKKFGRVGDAPIIGAGTYADNQTCAVSATGHGEYFIRAVVGYDVAALMAYKQLSVQAAAEEVVMKKLVEMGGEGGIIALDKNGNFAMPFNSAGMYRGFIRADGVAETAIFK